MNCSVEHTIEDDLDDIIVNVTVDPRDIPTKTFSNNRKTGTWIDLQNLVPGTRYQVTAVPIIRSTTGVRNKFEIITVVSTPVFGVTEFINATAAVGNLSIDGSFDDLTVSLYLDILESQRQFASQSDTLLWMFSDLVPGKDAHKAIIGKITIRGFCTVDG